MSLPGGTADRSGQLFLVTYPRTAATEVFIPDPTTSDTPMNEPQIGRLLLGEELGETGRVSLRHGVDALKAWGNG